MSEKKAVSKMSGFAMGMFLACLVLIGSGAIVLEGQKAASGGASVRVGMLGTERENLRAQLYDALTTPPPLPPPLRIIRVERSDDMSDPLIYRQNIDQQVMGSFKLFNDSDDVVMLRKVTVTAPSGSAMSSVRGYLVRTGESQIQFGSTVSVPNQSTPRDVIFSNATGLELRPHSAAVLNISGKPLFSKAVSPSFLAFKSAEVFSAPVFGTAGQGVTTVVTPPPPPAPTSTITLANDPDNVPARYLVMGSTDQILYKMKMTAGSAEDVKVLDITFADEIADNAAGVVSLQNARLYDETGVVVGGAVNMVLGQTGLGRIQFMLGSSSALIIPKGASRTVIVKADVATFVSGAAKSGSKHRIGIVSVGDVVAVGKDSGRASVVTGTPSGTIQAVYRTKPTLSSSVIGQPVGRARVAVDELASLVWSANATDDLTIQNVTVKFTGSAIASGTPAFSVSLIDQNTNGAMGTYQTCSPVMSGGCSVVISPQMYIARGTSRTLKLRVNSSAFNATPNNQVSLSAAIDMASGITWSDGTTNGIGWEPNLIPITLANVAYPAGSVVQPVGGLSASTNAAFASPTYAPGASYVRVGSFILTASSTEAVRVSSLSFDKDMNAMFDAQNLKVMVGGNQFGATKPVVADTEISMDFPSASPIVVPAGGSTIIDLYADILGSTAQSTHMSVFDLVDGAATGAVSSEFIPFPASSGNQKNRQSIVIGASASLVVATDPDNVSARYLVMGSVDNMMYKLRLSATGEGIRLNSIRFTDTIGGYVAGVATLNNVRLYDGSTLIAGPVNMELVSGTPTSRASFSFSTSSPFIVPRDSSRTITVKADVATFVSGGATSNSRHTFGVTATTDVYAVGSDSGVVAAITGTPSGSVQAVYRTKPSLSSSQIGQVTGRARVAIDEIATLVWAANAADDVTIQSVRLRFTGAAVGPIAATFPVYLIDQNTNISWGQSTEQFCVPATGGCSVAFAPDFSIARGSSKAVKLRVNSSNFGNASNTGDSLSVTIETASGITWNDGTTNGISWEAIQIPITIVNASYE